MPIDKEEIIRRIDYLINLAKSRDFAAMGEITSGTISILEILYGTNSEKMKAYVQTYQNYNKNPRKHHMIPAGVIRNITGGVLKSIKAEIEAGLIGNLELQAQGGIFADFIALAKQSLDQSKDVAAVLVSAALEDALKRFALQNGLEVEDADMEQVINALKSKGLMKGSEADLAKTHKQLRKYAFHANWDKFKETNVSSAIGFTERFILENFS